MECSAVHLPTILDFPGTLFSKTIFLIIDLGGGVICWEPEILLDS